MTVNELAVNGAVTLDQLRDAFLAYQERLIEEANQELSQEENIATAVGRWANRLRVDLWKVRDTAAALGVDLPNLEVKVDAVLRVTPTA